MADPAPEFKPDIAAALHLSLLGHQHLIQALRSLIASSPMARDAEAFAQRAQRSIEGAMALLADPHANEPPPVDPGIDHTQEPMLETEQPPPAAAMGFGEPVNQPASETP